MSEAVRLNFYGAPICGVESTAQYSFMAGGHYCSLPPEHVDDPNSAHVAYSRHIITNRGEDVIWLGPWADDRPYQGPETDRLQEEWDNRPLHDPYEYSYED